MHARIKITSRALALLLCLDTTVARSACPDEFAQIGATASQKQRGVIPGFRRFFEPVASREALLQKAEKAKPGESLAVLHENGNMIWTVEAQDVVGQNKPRLVAIKTSKYPEFPQDEVQRLKVMSRLFRENGVDQYFDVIEPLESHQLRTTYPFLEALDFRELTRTAHMKTEGRVPQFKYDSGGPISKELDPDVANLWSRFDAGVDYAKKKFRKQGLKVEEKFEISEITGKKFRRSLRVEPPGGNIMNSFWIRSSDILVTTDGRFVIIDPY